jgi:transcription elongation factor Elf1
MPLKKVAEMVPELTTCDECGRTVIVLCWGHDTDEAAQLHAVRDSNDQGFSCTVDCPVCGTRIQTVETLPLEPCD